MTTTANKFLLLFSFLALLASGVFQQQFSKPQLNFSAQALKHNYQPELFALFHMGQKRALASLMWINILLESDEKHYKKRDLNSWLYLRLKTLTDLDPYFIEAYRFGSLYLSVIKDDKKGAEALLTQGLQYFPTDSQLNFIMGFHQYFELKQFDKALPYLKRIYPSAHPLIQKALKAKEN